MRIVGNNLFIQDSYKTNQHVTWNFENNRKVESNYGIFDCDINQDKNIKVGDSGGGIASLIKQQVYDDLITDKISKKVARGEELTEEEKKTIEKIDPEKLRKAEMANKKRQQLEMKLRNSKNHKEAKSIMMEAKTISRQISVGIDSQYGELLMQGINKSETNYYKKEDIKTKPLNKGKFLEENKKGGIFDVKL